MRRRALVSVGIAALVVIAITIVVLGVRPQRGVERGTAGHGGASVGDARETDDHAIAAAAPATAAGSVPPDPPSPTPETDLARAAAGGEGAATEGIAADQQGDDERDPATDPSAPFFPPPPGPLDRDGIRQVVAEHVPVLQACYEQALRARPELTGMVEIELRIEADGRTTNAHVADDLIDDPLVVECFSMVFGRMRFQRPADGQPVTVHYPIQLSPDAPEEREGI